MKRITLTSIHFAALLSSAWILFGTGQEFVFKIFGESAIESPLICRIMIFFLTSVYFLRLCITNFVMLKRHIPWEEVMEVGPFVAIVQLSIVILTIYHKESCNYLDILLLSLFALGSFLNTGSEWQRMIWKRDESNKGKLYTKGLFKYSMHVNYLGDSISFAALGLLTGSIWGLSISIIMTLGFIFMHIPKLDKYLKEKYKEQFDDYARTTKKFIPWIY